MKRTLCILLVFLLWIAVGIVGKLLFLAVHSGIVGTASAADWFSILVHGVRLDIAIAGYLTIFPLLVGLVSVWLKGRGVNVMWNIVAGVEAAMLSLAIISNIALYGYWGFPLDSTPFFYFASSPQDAMASASIWQILGGILALVVMTGGITWLCHRLWKRLCMNADAGTIKGRLVQSGVLIVMAAMLFLPIRGGFTVAANNTGSVYFSENIRMNHAAVNPLFSLMESLSHEEDFASQYRFMPDDEAQAIFSTMIQHGNGIVTANEAIQNGLLKHKPKKVIIVVLESFSSYIMDDGEGNLSDVTPNLNRMKNEGLYFTQFYANSFRTDRGLMAILSGYPAQPTMSLMKYPRKTNELYSIARSLKNSGFKTSYVYGGDANFTNMRSYLMATGYDKIISEEDYPKSERTGKWGVNDSILFDRAMKEIAQEARNQPSFRVIQTSSSHEPFDVPHHSHSNPALNAFNYTDQQLGRFVAELKAKGDWENTLLIVVPDHLGCYPEPDGFAPYFNKIPMIMLGGVINATKRIETIGGQQDIAATLLSILGISHDEFTFSKDLFDTTQPHFAFFTFPDAVGMVTENDHFMYDNRSQRLVYSDGCHTDMNLKRAQAYLQCLYDDIAKR